MLWLLGECRKERMAFCFQLEEEKRSHKTGLLPSIYQCVLGSYTVCIITHLCSFPSAVLRS